MMMSTARKVFLIAGIYALAGMYACTSHAQVADVDKTIENTACAEPAKKYNRTVRKAVKKTVAGWYKIKDEALHIAVQRDAPRLTKHIADGMDLNLLLYTICNMSAKRRFETRERYNLLELASRSWNIKFNAIQHRAGLAQVSAELGNNLRTMHALKQYADTMLAVCKNIAGARVLRNPEVPLLYLLLPAENLHSPYYDRLVREQRPKIDSLLEDAGRRKQEWEKFKAAGKPVTDSLEKALAFWDELAAAGTAHTLSTSAWEAHWKDFVNMDLEYYNWSDKNSSDIGYRNLKELVPGYKQCVENGKIYFTQARDFMQDPALQTYRWEHMLMYEHNLFNALGHFMEKLEKNIYFMTPLKKHLDILLE